MAALVCRQLESGPRQRHARLCEDQFCSITLRHFSLILSLFSSRQLSSTPASSPLPLQNFTTSARQAARCCGVPCATAADNGAQARTAITGKRTNIRGPSLASILTLASVLSGQKWLYRGGEVSVFPGRRALLDE